MAWSRLAVAALFVSGLLSGSCKKEEAEPEAVPIPTPSATPVVADPSPVPTAAPVDTAAPAASTPAPPVEPPPAGTASAAAAASEPAGAPHAGGATILPCCKALTAVATKSGKSPESKAKAATAARVCYGIDKLVKAGKTQRSKALIQVRSSLVGTTPPDECN